MKEGKGLDWGKLGRADYSQAAAVVASLPEEVRWKIQGISRELLTRVLFLSWHYATHSGRGRGYCWPTLSTLAKYCHRSERTVERHLALLKDLGLLDWTRRLTKAGAYTSNLYTLGARLLASLFARVNRFSSIKSHTTFLSSNDLKREYKAGAQHEEPGLMQKLREKWASGLASAPYRAALARAHERGN